VHQRSKALTQFAVRAVHRALCLILFFLAAASHLTSTPMGVHCPTAKAQTVTEMVQTVDCCGRPVTLQVERKLQPGEKGFKQCRCAEKKASQANQDAAVKDPGITLACPGSFEESGHLHGVVLPGPGQRITAALCAYSAPCHAPPVPPPNAV
jgi:hypothetical protein